MYLRRLDASRRMMLEPSNVDGVAGQYPEHLQNRKRGARSISIGLQNAGDDAAARQVRECSVPMSGPGHTDYPRRSILPRRALPSSDGMIFVALTATTVDEEEPQLLDQKIATEKVTTIECPAKPTRRRSHEATQPRLLTRAELDGRTTAAKAGTFPHLPSSADRNVWLRGGLEEGAVSIRGGQTF
jgi:hypothetical protein